MGWVHPTTGDTDGWIVPWLNHQVGSRVLEDFAQHFDRGKHKQVILGVDQAAFHTRHKVRCLDELAAATAHCCRVLLKRRDRIQGLTNFYWWAEAVG